MDTFLNRARWARLVTTVVCLLAGVARAASTDTLSISWDPSASDDVVGYRVYLGTTAGVYTSSVDVGLVTAWNFTAAVAGTRYCFAVAAYTADASEGQKSYGACGYSDRAPVLTNPGAQASADGQGAMLQLVGSDPDGLAVTFSATGLPPGLVLREATGFIEGMPTARGVYSVTTSVSDGVLTAAQTFTWTVHSGPEAPVLAQDGTAPTISITEADESGNRGTDTLTVVMDTTPPDVTIDTPTTAGSYRATTGMVTMSGTASDANGLTQVAWRNDRGANGTTIGSTEWILPFVPLHDGTNTITITAVDTVGNSAAATLVVTYDAADLSPMVAITEPGGPSVSVSTPTVTVAGTVLDDRGAVELTWVNNRGGTGALNTSGPWTLPGVALERGANVITVSARDGAGRTALAQVLVQYTPPEAVQVSPPSRQPQPSPLTAPSAPKPSDPAPPQPRPAPARQRAQQRTMPPPPFSEPNAQAQLQLPETANLNVSQASAEPPRPPAAPPPRPTGGGTAPTEPPPVTPVSREPAPEAPRADALFEPTLTAPRRTVPRIVIAEPADGRYTTTAASVTVSGEASLPGGVTLVTWSSENASSGQALGTEAWRIEQLPLAVGTNVITVIASDGGSEIVTAQLVVVRTEPLSVSVTMPTAAERLTTSERSVALVGTASGEVSKVTWTADWGGSGTANGTKAWRIDAVGLERGVNVITITASDAEGRVARRVLTITSNPPVRRSRNR